MALYALTAMIFLVTLALTTSVVYFLVAAPASRKRMQTRLAAIEQASFDAPAEELGLLRAEVLSQVPWVNRVLRFFDDENTGTSHATDKGHEQR